MFLLIIIYLAFISLGLPDSILGSAWPVIRTEWGLSLDAAGYVSLVLIGSTVISSFMSGRIIKKLGTAKLTIISCLITGCSLLGYSYAPSYLWLIGFSIPLGLGAGAVDAGLNTYVSRHYKAHHMNWLHAFWGIGASAGPIIMSAFLLTSWHSGYRVVAGIQLSLFVLMLLSYKIWPKETYAEDSKATADHVKKKGTYYAYGAFLLYCMIEFSIGLWSSSYFVKVKLLSPDAAARLVALYYSGITIGRIISGGLTFKLKNKTLIQGGLLLSLFSLIILIITKNDYIMTLTMVVIGTGLAAFYPSMIHETPKHFGQEAAQHIIGYQVGFASIGSAVFPTLVGLLLRHTSLTILPYVLIVSLGLVYIFVTQLYRVTHRD